jgi:hypothetical protein
MISSDNNELLSEDETATGGLVAEARVRCAWLAMQAIVEIGTLFLNACVIGMVYPRISTRLR